MNEPTEREKPQRRITFSLHVKSFVLIPEKTVSEDNMLCTEHFDQLVTAIKALGCTYRIEKVIPPVLIEESTP